MSFLSFLCVFLFRFSYLIFYCLVCFFFFKQKTAYEMRISDWSSDVCSSDLVRVHLMVLDSFFSSGFSFFSDSNFSLVLSFFSDPAFAETSTLVSVITKQSKTESIYINYNEINNR